MALSSPVVDLVFVTYNRLEYTRRALASILADPAEEFGLTIWDNASTDGTAEFLKTEVSDRRIRDIVCSKTNIGQIPAVNRIWSASKAELLGKLDNDCLMTPGWTRILAQAHRDISELGIVACFHFFDSDFDLKRAQWKIQRFGNHQILRHPWTCGTGFLIKRSVYNELGPIEGDATTDFWVKLAQNGYINGFYYPLVFQEHMDDPKSQYCQLKHQAGFEAAKGITVTLANPKVAKIDDLYSWREEVLTNLFDEPWDVRYYVGWRDRVRKAMKWVKRTTRPRPARPVALL